MVSIIGIVILILVCISVKLFDDVIRPRHMLKVIVNTMTFLGLITFIVGLIMLVIK